MTATTATASVRPRAATRGFYVGLMLFYAAVAFVGFLPSYFGPLATGALQLTPLKHLHGGLMLLWVAFPIVQASLVATRRTDLHRLLGLASIGLVGAIFVVMCLAVRDSQLHFTPLPDIDQPALFLIQISDVALFLTFYVWALLARHEPGLHKRLMVLMIVSLLDAATGRMMFLPTFGIPNGIAYSLWNGALLLPPILYDLVTLKRVGRGYLLGGGVFVLVQALRAALWGSALWAGVHTSFMNLIR